MNVTNALAGIAVRDLDVAVAKIACVEAPDGDRLVFAEGVGPANRSAST